MTWDDLQKLLRAESAKLGSSRCGADMAPNVDTFELHKRVKQEVDAAISEFSISRKWPELDALSQLMLLERIRFAESIVTRLSLELPPQEVFHATVDDSALIRSLLIEAWDDEEAKPTV